MWRGWGAGASRGQACCGVGAGPLGKAKSLSPAAVMPARVPPTSPVSQLLPAQEPASAAGPGSLGSLWGVRIPGCCGVCPGRPSPGAWIFILAVSPGYCAQHLTQVPQNQRDLFWLFPGARIPRSRCWWGHAPSRGPVSFLLLFGSASRPGSRACLSAASRRCNHCIYATPCPNKAAFRGPGRT